MGRFAVTAYSAAEKESESRPRRALHQLARSECLLLQSLRLWAHRGRPHLPAQTGDWRQAFIASLDPARRRDGRSPTVQIVVGMFEDLLADFGGFLGILTGGPHPAWRFHPPHCHGVDATEAALLDLLRLAQLGDAAAVTAVVRRHVDEMRAERALRSLAQVLRVLAGSGLSLPLPDGTGNAGLARLH